MLYLVDASVFVFRAWYSLPDTMTDPQGRPVNALYGYARFLTQFLDEVRPEVLAVAFDESLTTSYRNHIYPDYKANREPAPPELERQFQLCRAITRAMGVTEFASPEYEADDIIATLAERGRAEGRPVTVVSRDKDLAQVLRAGDTYWDYAVGKRVPYAEAAEHFGVAPERMADYLALMGDSVDNIPGVPGVGKKTAAAVMNAFEDLDAVYTDLDRLATLPVRGAKGLAAKLAEHEAAARLARRLTGLHTGVPLDMSLTGLSWRGPDLADLERLYTEAGFGPALGRHARRLAGADGA